VTDSAAAAAIPICHVLGSMQFVLIYVTLLLTIFKQWPASAHRYTSHLINKLLIAHQISADEK
jgi:hypothetical protein